MDNQITFEKALFEAYQYTTTNRCRYNLKYIKVTDTQLIATNGKCLYIATPKNMIVTDCYLSLAMKADDVFYPTPKKPKKDEKAKLHTCFVDCLGTRFVKDIGLFFPPIDKVIPKSFDSVIDCYNHHNDFFDFNGMLKIYIKKSKLIEKEFRIKNQGKKNELNKTWLVLKMVNNVVTLCFLNPYGDKEEYTMQDIYSKPVYDIIGNDFIILLDWELYTIDKNPVKIGFAGSEKPLTFDYGDFSIVYHLPVRIPEDFENNLK